MKRFLLIPAIALVFIACREKHVTSTSTPPAPDPNGYSTAPPVDNGSNNGSGSNTGNGGVTINGSGSGSNTNTSGSNSNVNTDTVVVVKDAPTSEDSVNLSRLVVSFISKGAGTDHAAKANLDKWLSKHPDVKYKEVTWGREGEVDYIFDLKARTTADQQKVVSDVRTVIGVNDRVLVMEWAQGHEPRNTGIVPPSIDAAPADSLTRLVVSFISKGAGIDHAAQANLDNWLMAHKEVKYFVTHRGREGEMKYCFLLNDRRAESQVTTIKEIRAAIGTSDRVIFEENVKCEHAHQAAVTTEGDPNTPPPPGQTVDTSNTARLVVSFISKGEGIDHVTQTDFEKWCTERNVTWEVTHWGREGEVNYCFRLANMDTRQQDIFVRDARTFLSGKELVQVEEYAPCDKRK